jgi:uncharacterized C2H2 Zn-finger protein
MRAFEIHVNGKKLCVAGLKHGTLNLFVGCTENKHGRGDIGLNMTGTLLNLDFVRWTHQRLDKDAEVRLKIVETRRADKPEFLHKAPRDPLSSEKAYVRRKAKEFGWTIQTGTQKKKRTKSS